ncbi:hypothetical protein C8F04DRAFT_1259560 [Mycena alexandri]|uniref:Ubiquitin-like domain-containing protein n=1 Tax=Mycena alexandri TaxID=1745969 RepID=A0AAD6SXY8_9AGAR|nr:hypothetical protein C8F04DRAFT_1259560 [Mycena alexandri]
MSLFDELTTLRGPQSRVTGILKELLEVVARNACQTKRNVHSMYLVVSWARDVLERINGLAATAGNSTSWDDFNTFTRMIISLEGILLDFGRLSRKESEAEGLPMEQTVEEDLQFIDAWRESREELHRIVAEMQKEFQNDSPTAAEIKATYKHDDGALLMALSESLMDESSARPTRLTDLAKAHIINIQKKLDTIQAAIVIAPKNVPDDVVVYAIQTAMAMEMLASARDSRMSSRQQMSEMWTRATSLVDLVEKHSKKADLPLGPLKGAWDEFRTYMLSKVVPSGSETNEGSGSQPGPSASPALTQAQPTSSTAIAPPSLSASSVPQPKAPKNPPAIDSQPHPTATPAHKSHSAGSGAITPPNVSATSTSQPKAPTSARVAESPLRPSASHGSTDSPPASSGGITPLISSENSALQSKTLKSAPTELQPRTSARQTAASPGVIASPSSSASSAPPVNSPGGASAAGSQTPPSANQGPTDSRVASTDAVAAPGSLANPASQAKSLKSPPAADSQSPPSASQPANSDVTIPPSSSLSPSPPPKAPKSALVTDSHSSPRLPASSTPSPKAAKGAPVSSAADTRVTTSSSSPSPTPSTKGPKSGRASPSPSPKSDPPPRAPKPSKLAGNKPRTEFEPEVAPSKSSVETGSVSLPPEYFQLRILVLELLRPYYGQSLALVDGCFDLAASFSAKQTVDMLSPLQNAMRDTTKALKAAAEVTYNPSVPFESSKEVANAFDSARTSIKRCFEDYKNDAAAFEQNLVKAAELDKARLARLQESFKSVKKTEDTPPEQHIELSVMITGPVGVPSTKIYSIEPATTLSTVLWRVLTESSEEQANGLRTRGYFVAGDKKLGLGTELGKMSGEGRKKSVSLIVPV